MNKRSFKIGFLPGILATLCCLGPLFLIMFGMISASTALSFTMYNRYFILLAILTFAVTIWFYIRKRKQFICSGCTTKEQERKRVIYFIVFSAFTAVLTYVVLFYIVLPWLGPIVYKNFYRG